ncbi:hypothetical protein BOX15_Mlig009875g2, partial [Macrostomum lignano]
QLLVAMDNKASKSKEEIRRMMRLTAAKMQLKKPSNVVNNSEAAAAATATTSSSSSAALDDTDSVKGHPFARYNSLNQLTCILCGCPVKSSLLWRAHLASRGHRANAEALRSRGGDRAVEILSGAGLKRRLQETSEKQQKKQPSSALGLAYSDDEEEAEDPAPSKKSQQLHQKQSSASSSLLNRQPQQQKKQQQQQQQQLPEGFFDDPVADARARNVPYKDRMEEELELFAKEMRDAQVESDKIAEQAEEEADNVRYLEEIITQEETWHRLNELELLKEAATIKQEAKSAMKLEPAAGDGSPTDEADIDEAELELGLDCWRKKKL